jgi:hypothetical protein
MRPATTSTAPSTVAPSIAPSREKASRRRFRRAVRAEVAYLRDLAGETPHPVTPPHHDATKGHISADSAPTAETVQEFFMDWTR